MQAGQKLAMMAITWYGVQHAANAPRMIEIVLSAFLARFSDLSLSFFLRNRIRLPICGPRVQWSS